MKEHTDYNNILDGLYKTGNKKSSNLESLLLNDSFGNYQSCHSRFTLKISSFDSDYERMRRLAVEEDDFEQILTVFNSILQKSHGLVIDEAKKILREVHETYADTQRILAKTFGNHGQFDLAEEHLQNACLGCQIEIGSHNRLVLESRTEEEEANQIMNNAINNASPQYFLQKVMAASQDGDVEGFRKYISLSLQNLKESGIIKIPDREEIRRGEIPNSKRHQTFFQLQVEFYKLNLQTYRIAVKKRVEKAVGFAINSERYTITSDKAQIEKLAEETQDLMLDSVKETVPDVQKSDAFSRTLMFFNELLNPLYSELLVCREDENHPLRTLFKPIKRNDSIYEKVIGSERIHVEATAVVPQRFYKRMFEQKGIPVAVHPFFNPIVRIYEESS